MADTIRPNMTLDDEVQHYLAACEALKGVEINAETAPRFRTLQADEVKLRRRLNEAKSAEKEPHLTANNEIEARYRPKLASIAEACRVIGNALTMFLEAEEAKRREAADAARKAAEEERARAAKLAEAAKVEDDPFEAFDKAEEARRVEADASALSRQAAAPVKVNVAGDDGARAAGLRTVGWIVEVEDPSALVGHYAHRTEFVELAKKMAAAEAKATKGQCKVPGVKFVADRRAA